MWIFFGHRSKFHPVKGGRQENRYCAECDKVTTFTECDAVDKVHILLVDVIDLTQRRLVCKNCGFDIGIDETHVSVSLPQTRSSSQHRQFNGEAAKVKVSDPDREKSKEQDLDKRLAELKAKISNSIPVTTVAHAVVPVPTPAPAPDPTAPSRHPTKLSVRKVLKYIFRIDSKLEAFCIDCFPDVSAQFTIGMDRESKFNLLIQLVDPELILKNLLSHEGELLKTWERVIEYE